MPSSSKALNSKRRNKGVRSPRPLYIHEASTGTPPEKLRKRARYRRSLTQKLSPTAPSMTPSHSTTSPPNSSQAHAHRDGPSDTRPTTPQEFPGSGSEAPPTTPASQRSAGSDGTPDFPPFKITHETFLVSTLKKMAFGLNDGLQVPSTTAPPNSPAGGLMMKA
ncbi:hypothetical protein M413DRAFT_31443 [Hebeloma cylindrosporum]|uniref:Uncharacterized protein n=1 Tax=Hebeloma cylindrosporum TaxID=76867 RepID=A0A0C3BXN6_HEBCY|nr:hypothetical protein M413DRAFT_31443 [Hebeloma cylindrosporum h7]